MKRIKYERKDKQLVSSMYNYIAEIIDITIRIGYYSEYEARLFNRTTKQIVTVKTNSLQQAKRKARKLAIEEFGVNLGIEVRNVLCT